MNYILKFCVKKTLCWKYTRNLVSLFLGYKHMKKYRDGFWDGQIHLYNRRNKTLPLGLLGYLLRMAKDNQWPINVDKSLKLISFENELEKFQDVVFPDLLLEPYDYQVETFIKSIMLNRSLVLSPTGSR